MNPLRPRIDSAMGMDHRWGKRQPTDLAVRFVANAGITGTGRVLNVSLTGAYLQTPVPLRLLSLVYLEPDTSGYGDEARRCIAASVVRRDALGVGLEWCDFSTAATNLSARLAILTVVSHPDIGYPGPSLENPSSVTPMGGRDRHQQFIVGKSALDHGTGA